MPEHAGNLIAFYFTERFSKIVPFGGLAKAFSEVF